MKPIPNSCYTAYVHGINQDEVKEVIWAIWNAIPYGLYTDNTTGSDQNYTVNSTTARDVIVPNRKDGGELCISSYAL